MKSGAMDNYFLKLSPQSLNTHLLLPVKAGEAEDKGLDGTRAFERGERRWGGFK